MKELCVREFYSREVMTPKAIKKLIDLFEEECNETLNYLFDITDGPIGFPYLFGTYEVFENFGEYIKENYPDIKEYDPRLFEGEVFSIAELTSLLEEWYYDVLDFDSKPNVALNFSKEVLAEFIYQDEKAFDEFGEFFTYEGITPSSSWFDPPFEMKDKFELYLKSNGKR